MKKIFLALFVLTIIGGLAYIVHKDKTTPGKYDTLAQCIKDSGATFYGAFWCPHCQAQKALFGKSAKLLPYYECSTPSGDGQLQECTDKKIEAYPTWELKDGTRLLNETDAGITLKTLAEKTMCELPKE